MPRDPPATSAHRGYSRLRPPWITRAVTTRRRPALERFACCARRCLRIDLGTGVQTRRRGKRGLAQSVDRCSTQLRGSRTNALVLLPDDANGRMTQMVSQDWELPVLVSGASGRLGRQVIVHLLDRYGVPARQIIATTRSPELVADLAARGVIVRSCRFRPSGVAWRRPRRGPACPSSQRCPARRGLSRAERPTAAIADRRDKRCAAGRCSTVVLYTSV